MEEALSRLPEVNIMVYEPTGTPAAEKMTHDHAVPKMTPGRAALVMLTRRYLEGLLDPFVTLLEIHKLMYFLQEYGEPLRLRYVKASYGPYAENLRHVLNRVEGHLLSGYADGGDDPDKSITISPGAEKAALALLAKKTDTNERVNRVARLVEGFESQFGLELLSTVHWVMIHEKISTLDEIIDKIYNCGPQKSKFSRRQIEIAVSHLIKNGFGNPKFSLSAA
jgi:hypothetical protein